MLGLYTVLHSPRPLGGEVIKGFGGGEGNLRGEKRDNRKFWENKIFGST